MAELKTKKNEASVEEFLHAVPDEQQRADAHRVLELMQEITGEEPAMWGASIIGFGQMRYRYASGREGDWFAIGFSPRKAAFSLYVTMDATAYPELMKKLGKHTTGKGCIYVKRLSDIDMKVLEELIRTSYADISKS